MMDTVAAIAFAALALWLIRGAPRPRKRTDEEILADRRRRALDRTNRHILAQYELDEPRFHWWN